MNQPRLFGFALTAAQSWKRDQRLPLSIRNYHVHFSRNPAPFSSALFFARAPRDPFSFSLQFLIRAAHVAPCSKTLLRTAVSRDRNGRTSQNGDVAENVQENSRVCRQSLTRRID